MIDLIFSRNQIVLFLHLLLFGILLNIFSVPLGEYSGITPKLFELPLVILSVVGIAGMTTIIWGNR